MDPSDRLLDTESSRLVIAQVELISKDLEDPKVMRNRRRFLFGNRSFDWFAGQVEAPSTGDPPSAPSMPEKISGKGEEQT